MISNASETLKCKNENFPKISGFSRFTGKRETVKSRTASQKKRIVGPDRCAKSQTAASNSFRVIKEKPSSVTFGIT